MRSASIAKCRIAFGADTGIAAIQARLNVLGANPPLTVDGISGPMTVAAIKAFQQSKGLTPDGIVGPLTLAALGMNGGSTLTPTIPTTTSGGIAAVRGLETKSDAFKNKLMQVAQSLGISVDWLATVMSFETAGTFSPSIQNPGPTKATGLIQFTSPTATTLGTSLDALKSMSDVKQLDYVYKYLEPHKGHMRNLDDTYLAVFMPSQMGKSSDSIVAYQGSKVYDQNAGFDQSGKGYFTVGDITNAIHAVYNAGIGRGRIPVGAAIAGSGALALIGAGLGLRYFLKKRKS
jgi:hypothetical protein